MINHTKHIKHCNIYKTGGFTKSVQYLINKFNKLLEYIHKYVILEIRTVAAVFFCKNNPLCKEIFEYILLTYHVIYTYHVVIHVSRDCMYMSRDCIKSLSNSENTLQLCAAFESTFAVFGLILRREYSIKIQQFGIRSTVTLYSMSYLALSRSTTTSM